MSLRLRLALTLVVVAVPLILGMGWLRDQFDNRAFEQSLEQTVTSRMGVGRGIEECDEAPTLWGGYFGYSPEFMWQRRGDPRRRRWPSRSRPRRNNLRLPYFWAYQENATSLNPLAPPIPGALRRSLEDGARSAWTTVVLSENDIGALERDLARGQRRGPPTPPNADPRDFEHIVFVMRIDTDSTTCPIVMLDGFRPPRRGEPFGWMPLALAATLVLVVLFAVGPLVRRVRTLTAEVGDAAGSHYADPVTVEGNDEVAHLAEAFNRAGRTVRSHIDSLTSRERTLREFIGNTTHDVMIPLTVLQGHLAALQAQAATQSALDQKALAAAQAEAQYIGSILHNLSAIAKLEGGELQVRNDSVDLNALVARAVTRHATIARSSGIELDYSVPEEPLVVAGDVTLIEQAVSNVIHNAVRYNGTGGHVAVMLVTAASGRFSLRVIDDGPGIASDDLEKLTERKFRGDKARTRNPSGLGLGLHIASDVAQRHGFALEFLPSEYGGLEVRFGGDLSEHGVS